MVSISENPEKAAPEQGWGGKVNPILVATGIVAIMIYFSVFLVWLTPIPILYAFKKGKLKWGVTAVVCSVALLSLLYFGLIPWVNHTYGTEKVFDYFFLVPGVGTAGWEQNWNFARIGLGFYGFFALIGALLGDFENKTASLTQLFLMTLGILIGVFVLGLAWYCRGNFSQLVSQIQDYFVSWIHEFAKSVPQANEEIKARLDWMEKNAESSAYFAVRLIPAILINMAIFEIWLNIVVARKIFFKDVFFAKLGALRRWRFSFFGVWAVIAGALAFLLNSYVLQQDWLMLVAMNAFIVFGLIYFFQGLAIVVFYTVRWNLSPMARFFVYAILILLLQSLGSVLLIALGFFDSWFDFRKLNKPTAARAGG